MPQVMSGLLGYKYGDAGGKQKKGTGIEMNHKSFKIRSCVSLHACVCVHECVCFFKPRRVSNLTVYCFCWRGKRRTIYLLCRREEERDRIRGTYDLLSAAVRLLYDGGMRII